MENGQIRSVTGWQMTTQRFHRVRAKLFADCSGDSILAPLTGAPFWQGREARGEFQESIEPEEADACTMGNSILLQAEETTEEHAYTAPAFAEKITREKLVHRRRTLAAFRRISGISKPAATGIPSGTRKSSGMNSWAWPTACGII